MNMWKGPLIEDSSITIVGEKVGRGGASIVFRGTIEGRDCAVKKFRVNETENLEPSAISQLYSEFRRELWNLMELQHKNILPLFALSTSHLQVTMEFMPYGNLYYYL